MKFLLILVLLVYIYSQTGKLYSNGGTDWPGICGTGSNQSPINIMDRINTVDTGKIILF
jgi:hypothetical protein